MIYNLRAMQRYAQINGLLAKEAKQYFFGKELNMKCKIKLVEL